MTEVGGPVGRIESNSVLILMVIPTDMMEHYLFFVAAIEVAN